MPFVLKVPAGTSGCKVIFNSFAFSIIFFTLRLFGSGFFLINFSAISLKPPDLLCGPKIRFLLYGKSFIAPALRTSL